MKSSSMSHTNSAHVLADDQGYPAGSLSHWPGRSRLCFQNLTHKEQIRQQGTEVDGRVQIIDQLRTDDRLSEDQLDRSERVAGVAGDHLEERVVAELAEDTATPPAMTPLIKLRLETALDSSPMSFASVISVILGYLPLIAFHLDHKISKPL